MGQHRGEGGTALIRVGIGGWTFPPWRGAFYPPGLPHAQELHYASTHVTSIEINATFYGSQKPESFRRWRETAPPGFVFSVKAPRGATHRRDRADAEPSVARFLESGITELGPALGPLLWQFPPTRAYDRAAFETFLALLPASQDGHALRHVVEVRHPSFDAPDFSDLLRLHGVARAMVDRDTHPPTHEPTADFVYARLERTEEDNPHGYPDAALDTWAARFRALAEGSPAEPPRDCFVYFISGAKVRAPAAAMALLRRL